MDPDPSANLAALIRASGLSQAQLAEQLEQRGLRVDRSTISRWIGPARTGPLRIQPAILEQLVDLCGAAIGLRLSVDDVNGPADDLERKCRFARDGTYLLGGLVADCVADFSARRVHPHLSGHYKIFIMSLFDPNRLRMSLLEIENEDGVSFRCRIHVLRNNRLADHTATLSGAHAELVLEGRLLVRSDVCHFVLESLSEPVMAMTIAARVPDGPPPVEALDGLMTLYGSPSSGSVVVSRYLMVRTSKEDFDRRRATGDFGELPQGYQDSNWVISQLTQGMAGPHLTLP